MKATIYKGIRQVALQELEIPKMTDDDVLVKVVNAGICGTDLHAYEVEGESVGIHPNNQFGHEMVGIIDQVGKNVTGITEGMRVFVDPNKRKPLGQGLTATEIADMAGAFSEYVLVEQAKLDYNIFKLPDSLPFEKAVLTEPFSVALHGVNIARPKPTDKAIVYGAGIIGLCTIAALKAKGVHNIIASDILDNRLAMAEKLGAIPFNGKAGSVVDFAKQIWGSDVDSMGQETTQADIVIDCAGYKGVFSEYMASAKTLSRLVIVALSGEPEPAVPYMFVAKDISVLGSRGYQAEDIKETIAILDEGKILIEPIITNHFGLSEIVKAFEVAADKSQEIKVIIHHDR